MNLKKNMHFTTDDTQKYLSNIYQWLTVNDDFNFISNSLNYCSSEEYTKLYAQLHQVKLKTRPILNNLSQAIEQIDCCVQQLKLTIERERAIRKQAIREKKQKKREQQ